MKPLYIRHDGAAAHLLGVLGRRAPAGDQRALDRIGRYPRWSELGVGELALDAIDMALQSFDGIVDELLDSIPRSELR